MQIESFIVLRSGRRRGPGWRPVPARARGEKTLPFYLSSPPSPCPSHRFPSRRMMVQEREREREEVCVKERRERGATERSEGDGRGGTFFLKKKSFGNEARDFFFLLLKTFFPFSPRYWTSCVHSSSQGNIFEWRLGSDATLQAPALRVPCPPFPPFPFSRQNLINAGARALLIRAIPNAVTWMGKWHRFCGPCL